MRISQLLGLVFILLACSTYKTRNKVYEGEISFKGGVYEDKNWTDSLEFKKISWFYDATLDHEILISKLDKSSPFSAWLGADRLALSTCENFYITILYSDINANHGNTLLTSQLKNAGLEEMSILNFTHQMKAHQNYLDWKLGRHKIVGFCQKNTNKSEIIVTIPGHKSLKLL